MDPKVAALALVLSRVAARSRAVVAAHWRECVVRRVVVVQAEADLLEIVGALHPVGGLPDLLNGREKQADQDRDDGDDDEEFDERKPWRPGTWRRGWHTAPRRGEETQRKGKNAVPSTSGKRLPAVSQAQSLANVTACVVANFGSRVTMAGS